MAQTGNFEDISVAWGRPRDPHDEAWNRWWRAVFQDLAVTPDGSRLFFLYDPVADEETPGSQGRKGGAAILVFDTNQKKFIREIALNTRENKEGQLKYFFLVQPESNTFAVVTQRGDQLQLWHLQLTPDGMNVSSGLNHIFGPFPVGDDWIIVLREDVPEIVLLTGPGLTVWRISALTPGSQPVDSYQVPDGDMRRYYDAVIWRGVVYLLAARPDELFDFAQVHILQLDGRLPMRTVGTRPDPQAGFPPNRKQTGIDICQGRLYLAGGEMESPQTGQVFRMQDVWALDLGTFVWQRMGQLQMSLPLIEPRLSIQDSGLVHVWGDCEIPQGCLAPPSHLHILRTWLAHVGAPPPTYTAAAEEPPSYDAAGGGGAYPSAPFAAPAQAPGGYPPQGGYQQQPAGYTQPKQEMYPPQSTGYPQQQGGYPSQAGYPQAPGSYPPQQPQMGGYPQGPQPYPQGQTTQYGGYPSQGPPTEAYYPNQGGKKKEKDCTIS